MDFNFDEESNKLLLANENINRVLNSYNNLLLGLDDKEKQIIQLFYGFKKLDTWMNMIPEGNYYDDKRETVVNKIKNAIQSLGSKIYPEIIDLDKLRDTVTSDMSGKLLDIIDGFSRDVKRAYKEQCENVYIVLPVIGLTELVESKHRENQYLNSI